MTRLARCSSNFDTKEVLRTRFTLVGIAIASCVTVMTKRTGYRCGRCDWTVEAWWAFITSFSDTITRVGLAGSLLADEASIAVLTSVGS